MLSKWQMKRRWFANADIPINILSRLTAKTLHHLKYVSKEWFNLISDRSFIRFQLKKEEPVAGFFFQEVFQWSDREDSQTISYIPVETENVEVKPDVLNFLPEKVVILSLTNGFLCCRSCFPVSHPRIYVCNPLNKQWVSLQWPELSRSTSIALVFDPFQNSIEASTNFLLVAVRRIETEEETEEDEYCFDIYSSQKGSWRTSKESCKCGSNLTKNKGVFAEGMLYWLTEGSEILMFDPENDFSLLIKPPLPVEGFDSVPEMCIGELEGKLHYVIISVDGLQLWVLEDQFVSQWGLIVSMSLEELEEVNADVLYDFRAKVASRVSRNMDACVDILAFKDGMLLLRVSAKVCSYRFGTGRMSKLCGVETLGPKSMFSPIVVPYSMSLVPLE